MADYLAAVAHWTKPVPNYAVLQGATGGASGVNQAQCRDGTAAQSTCLPLVLLFVVEGDEDHVHVGHSATAFLTVIADPHCSFNDTVVVLVGSDLATAIPFALPTTVFQCLAANRVHNAAHLTGPACHPAVPQVIRTGPHAGGAVDTNKYRVRPVFIPPS